MCQFGCSLLMSGLGGGCLFIPDKSHLFQNGDIVKECKTDQTGSAPAPSAAATSSGGQLEPALIHSDDDPSKEDDDKDDEILPTKDDIPRRKQHDADSDSSEE